MQQLICSVQSHNMMMINADNSKINNYNYWYCMFCMCMGVKGLVGVAFWGIMPYDPDRLLFFFFAWIIEPYNSNKWLSVVMIAYLDATITKWVSMTQWLSLKLIPTTGVYSVSSACCLIPIQFIRVLLQNVS